MINISFFDKNRDFLLVAVVEFANFIPRIGERVNLDGNHFVVENVTYNYSKFNSLMNVSVDVK